MKRPSFARRGGLAGAVSVAVAILATGPSGAAVRDGNPRPTAAGCDHAHHTYLSPAHLACGSAASGRFLAAGASTAEVRDLMQLTDEPRNWFRSEANGTPVTRVPVGGRVDFHAGPRTNTRHTVTLVSAPPGSSVAADQDHPIDQDDSQTGGIVSVTFDVPGVYIFLCKVHPYMTGVVLVEDASGNVPDITREQLPFIGHLGLQSLPASAALAAVTTIAPTDEEKQAKWEIGTIADQIHPPVPGVGEVWIDTQFEFVSGQTDDHMVPKPGTITVVDATTFTVEKEATGLDPQARFRWNNPHNMWANTEHSIVYNGHWFGRWHNKIARANADVLTTIEVGHSPTHSVSNPNEASDTFGNINVPLSALDHFVDIEDPAFSALQQIVDNDPTGVGRNHPHAQWVSSDGGEIVFPNVFKGFGVDGTISVVDMESDAVRAEFSGPAIKMPVATGIQSVAAGNKAYVSNIVSGMVSVIDLDTLQHIKDIPVTLTPNCLVRGLDVFNTLQVPIQPPVSPDGRFVAVAVLSLTTVPRLCTGSADHVAIIDTTLDDVVRFVPTAQTPTRSSGTHGANYGAKLGGGYYAYVANQFSNMLTVVDPDPNGDGIGADAAQVGRIFLGNGMPGGPRVTDGVGGQGIKPLPNVYDGWVQDTVAASAAGRTDAEVTGWINQLTRCQKNPSGALCTPAGPGR